MTLSIDEQIANLKQAFAAQEHLRSTLGDAVVDATLVALQKQLTELEAQGASPPRAGGTRGGAQQRKQITVLFADVSGFTALSETLDAEDVAEMMNALWLRLDAAITEHGGWIDKHIGDAVMALWGVETAREDDPERAIRAALALQAELGAFREERAAQTAMWDVALAMRVGLNTGPVLLGEVGTTREFTAMGDTVNLASRLEHAAPVGGILISHATYRHVRGVFDLQAQPPLAVKGKAEPVRAYVVQRAKPRAFRVGTRGIEGVETRMIGRDAELRALQAAYERVVAEGQLRAVTIVGEAGVGKSRLLFEFENWLELRPERIGYFKGRVDEQMQGVPLGLLRDMLDRRFEVRGSDPLPVVREKFRAGVAALLPEDRQAEMKAAVLGTWVGHDFSQHPLVQQLQHDPEQLRNRALLYLAQVVNAAAEKQPVLLLFEDIHWADASSLAAAQTLIRRPVYHPILILGITRPVFFERLPDWGSQMAHHTRVDLAPLSAADSQALVKELLQRVDPLPPMLLELVLNRAEGNPFYAEELVKMLIDKGAIRTGAGAWQVAPEKLVALEVPATLTGVLQARLDQLPRQELTAVQQAAVIGRIFWDAALAALEQDPERVLPPLESKEFIFPRGESSFAGTDEYVFKHALLRDVTYETVLKQLRRTYHRLVAEWLVRAAEANQRGDEYAALIGEHYHLAQEALMAAPWYGRAGKHAATTYANAEAAHYLTLALDLTPATETAERYALLLAREKTYDMQGNRTAQQADLAQLAALAGQLAVAQQAQVALRQARYAEATSDYEAAIAHARAAIALAEPAGLWDVVAEGYARWGAALLDQGLYAPAQEVFHHGLTSAQKGQHQEQAAECLHGLGNVAWYLVDYAAARSYYEQALAIRQEIGDRRGVSNSLNNLGLVARHLGEYAAARSYLEQALAISQEIGDRWGVSATLMNLGSMAWNLGEYAAARSYYEQSLAIRQEIGDRQGVSMCLLNLGAVAQYLGEYAVARSYYEQALAIQREIGDRRGGSVSLNNLGSVTHDLGEYAAACSYYEQALAIAQEIGDRWNDGITLNSLGMLALRQNQLEPALAHLQQALVIHQELNQPHYLVEDWVGLAQAAFLQGDRAQTATYLQQI
ncbi:MAG: tetratricopeptide repeat protein, partial [Anaerolineae bacterium]|nr:tetratricopeptide repeat protein [Anaerolineae bacterium]